MSFALEYSSSDVSTYVHTRKKVWSQTTSFYGFPENFHFSKILISLNSFFCFSSFLPIQRTNERKTLVRQSETLDWYDVWKENGGRKANIPNSDPRPSLSSRVVRRLGYTFVLHTCNTRTPLTLINRLFCALEEGNKPETLDSSNLRLYILFLLSPFLTLFPLPSPSSLTRVRGSVSLR